MKGKYSKRLQLFWVTRFSLDLQLGLNECSETWSMINGLMVITEHLQTPPHLFSLGLGQKNK